MLTYRTLPTSPSDLLAGESVHRMLRPQLPRDYAGFLTVMLDEGTKVTHAVLNDVVVGLAVWRTFTSTFAGRVLIVDDLVTAENERSQGYGSQLLLWLERQARGERCSSIHLDSAVHRSRAHAFYFREGMSIVGYHFVRSLGAPKRATLSKRTFTG